MADRKNIFVINGSASHNSSNEKLINAMIDLMKDCCCFTVFNALKSLPHFEPELSASNTPDVILEFRNSVRQADGILICTPEYIFSIPSGLKNAIEWCVATTVFSDKPIGLITASADGRKGHDALQLIMKTLMTRFTGETTLLIQGVKGKINQQGEITDANTLQELIRFTDAFKMLIAVKP